MEPLGNLFVDCDPSSRDAQAVELTKAKEELDAKVAHNSAAFDDYEKAYFKLGGREDQIPFIFERVTKENLTLMLRSSNTIGAGLIYTPSRIEIGL